MTDSSGTPGIDSTVPPSGTGCVECLDAGGWWFHLRRCAQCGHIGCCDSSPAQHASGHAAESGHPIVRTFEPGEDWFWDYGESQYYDGPDLAPPVSHPESQSVPGGKVPSDWQSKLHR